MTALLLGATGLVGRHTLALLLADDRFTRVVTLGRRSMDASVDKHTHHVLDFEAMDAHPDWFAADAVFCCLGTTIKQAGSEAAFRRVDHDYVLGAARHALDQGATHFLLVSSLGADPSSRIFYSRLKGEVEQALRALGFERLTIVRPSLLTGDRAESRPKEKAMAFALAVLRPVLLGPLSKYRPTPAEAVARALVAEALAARPGVTVLEADAIRAALRTSR